MISNREFMLEDEIENELNEMIKDIQVFIKNKKTHYKTTINNIYTNNTDSRDMLTIIEISSPLILFYYYKELLLTLFLISIFGSSIIISSIIISQSLTIKSNNLEDDEEEEKYKKTEHYQYIDFINNDYVKMQDIYKNDIELKTNYENNDENFLNSLMQKENHYHIKLPFINNEIYLYYNNNNKYYEYYTKIGDINYKVLNSICRTYVLNNKCLNIFTDEEEIEYIKSLNKCRTNSYDDLGCNKEENENEKNEEKEENENEENEENEEKEEKEEKEEVKSIFYKKKQKNKNKEEKEYIKNKFINKGNLTDYENKFNNIKKEVKNTDYSSYLSFINRR